MCTATHDAPVTTTVSALSDRHLLRRIKELTALEHHLEVVVIDHLRELHRRRLYLTLGYSSLFDYAVRELGYSEAAAWRRIKAMRLCAQVEGARDRLQDGSLTMNAAAQLQNAFDRQERRQAGGGGRNFGAEGRARPGAPAPSTQPQAEQPQVAPVLDGSARQALVEQAAGKSTRQVQELLAAVDPELSVSADRVRPLGERWEIKAVIDDDCRRGLERLKGLLSHVDPHLTLGQLLGRVVREAVERHDPARPPRRRRTGSRTEAGVADETSAPKDGTGRDAVAADRTALPAGVTTAAAKEQADSEHRRAVAAKRPAAVDRTATSAPKDKTGTGGAAPSASSARPAESGASPPKSAPVPAAPSTGAGPSAGGVTSAPKSERKQQERPPSEPKRPASAAPAKAGIRAGRAIPAAVRRQVWARDRGCCSYVDRASGRRCGSRHLLQMDHVIPYALGGSAEPDNLRLLCAAHHRHRHADRAAARR